MIRFAWLQSRTQTLAVTAALAALAIVAAVTGVHWSHLYRDLVGPCAAGRDCDAALGEFTAQYNFLQNALQFLLRIAPAIIGVFWGGPLIARELETGTYRLAWTQTVTRSRWILSKLAIIGGTAVVIAGLLTLTITWWYRALDHVDTKVYGGNLYDVFDARDITPIGYTFFAFMLGALLGVMIRRSLPAMATTLGVFVFVRVAVQQWVRPHLLSPWHTTSSLLNAKGFGFIMKAGGSPRLDVQGASPRGSWELSSNLAFNSTGHVASAADKTAFVHQYCPTIGPPPLHGTAKAIAGPDPGGAFNACQTQAAKTFHLVVSYQPASRYWTFQWLELAIYVVLGLLAAGLCYWWVTRRVR